MWVDAVHHMDLSKHKNKKSVCQSSAIATYPFGKQKFTTNPFFFCWVTAFVLLCESSFFVPSFFSSFFWLFRFSFWIDSHRWKKFLGLKIQSIRIRVPQIGWQYRRFSLYNFAIVSCCFSFGMLFSFSWYLLLLHNRVPKSLTKSTSHKSKKKNRIVTVAPAKISNHHFFQFFSVGVWYKICDSPSIWFDPFCSTLTILMRKSLD